MSPDDVRAAVVAVAHYTDARQWKELQELFAPTVAVDYTSLFGGAASQTNASELVGGWRAALDGVGTQHLLGPIDVRPTREGADAECHVRALHYRAGATGGEAWEVLGHYVFALALDGGAWRITKMKLETYLQLGNRALLSAK
jgi:SnoaL-like domain